MLRLLIGTGLLLMTVGFGAAGWQYWQSLPAQSAGATDATPADPKPQSDKSVVVKQNWLASPSGGLIAQDEVQGYLAQDRLVPTRMVLVTRQANLADLLGSNEALPQAEYLQVLADIRAPRLAEGLCAIVFEAGAADCTVNSARVVEGSVDPVTGTALFRLELAYRLPDAVEALPDLAAQVFRTAPVSLMLDPGAPGAASADLALSAALTAVADACAAETVGDLCRMLRLTLDWAPGQLVQARADIGWLDPLPQGVSVAPPLTPGQGG
ncbi:MAG: hypothetical protein ACKO2N_13975 [Tabrizicola sp.]